MQQTSLGQNFEERSAIVHTRGDKLAPRLGIGPSPRRATGQENAVTELVPAVRRAECRVVDKVVQVHVLALERVERVTRHGGSDAVDALGVVEARVDGRVEQTSISLRHPAGDLLGLVLLVLDAAVVELGGAERVLGHLLGHDDRGGRGDQEAALLEGEAHGVVLERRQGPIGLRGSTESCAMVGET